MKSIKYYIPIIGIFFMAIDTKFGRFSTTHFAGLAWLPWQLICIYVLSPILLLYITN